jgi:hypothetical protein
VAVYGTQQFFATVTGTSNTAVTWQVSCNQGGAACGVISANGLYSAPNSVPTVPLGNAGSTDVPKVTATSQADPGFSNTVGITITTLNQQTQPLPIQLGTSGSNANGICVINGSASCVTGTLGALLARLGKQYILSNNHVLALNDGASIGDPVVQPGLLDTPIPCDTTRIGTTTVGHLSEFVSMQTGSTPKIVDGAIAEVVSGAVDSSGIIEGLGSTVINGVPQAGAPEQGPGGSATINELVAKSGRSTGVTSNKSMRRNC